MLFVAATFSASGSGCWLLAAGCWLLLSVLLLYSFAHFPEFVAGSEAVSSLADGTHCVCHRMYVCVWIMEARTWRKSSLDGCARLLQLLVIFIGLFACRSEDICRWSVCRHFISFCRMWSRELCYGKHMKYYDLFLRSHCCLFLKSMIYENNKKSCAQLKFFKLEDWTIPHIHFILIKVWPGHPLELINSKGRLGKPIILIFRVTRCRIIIIQ